MPHALLGLAAFPLLAWVMSEDRRAVSPRRVALALVVQGVLAVVLLRLPGVTDALLLLNEGVRVLEEATNEGARFMFGYLAGGDLPFEERTPGGAFIVAFRVLPLVLVVSALSAVLVHVGLLPFVIRQVARLVRRVFHTSGALAFGAAASIFFGIIEGPVLVRAWLPRMNRSELFALLTCGMATVAGTVMVLYASIIEPVMPGALGQVLVASVLSVPAALCMAHVMVPGEAGADAALPEPSRPDDSAVEALMRGTQEGTRMVLDIAATIVVLFAMVHLVNRGLGLAPTDTPVTLQGLVGTLFTPLVWLAGVPWEEAGTAGRLMGTKVVLNEFVAYLELGEVAEALSPRSRRIVVTALCGFANLGSMGILVGGLGSALPDRRAELASLAARAVVAGNLATLLTGAVVALAAP